MRIAISETLDPDGAMAHWASPDLIALGHEVLPLPTQELAPLLGAHGLAAWIVAVAEGFRPDLVMVCPPYDHAPASTWAACRALGAKVVGFAMDEPLFEATRARPAVAARYDTAVRAFDRLYVAAPEAAAALADRGLPVRPLRWALSPASIGEVSLDPGFAARIATSAVLVGRPYARRVALLRALAEHVPVMVFGHGWEALAADALGRATYHGPLTGPAMHAVLARAGVVVTTGDWESTPIAMVKVRLLEAAFAGAAQVVQRSPDLDAYFPPDEVPRYDDGAALARLCRAMLADPLAARAAGDNARRRAHERHTWKARFAELATDLALPVTGTASSERGAIPPPAWIAGVSAAAGDAEHRGAHRLAAALYQASGDLMGQARTLLPIDPVAAAAAALAAIARRDAEAAATVGLYARLPTPAPALGHVGFLDPTPELEALRITALLAAGNVAGAEEAVHALCTRDDPDRLVATAAVLAPDDVSAHAQLWQTLFSAALASSPAERALYEQHSARFAQAAGDIATRETGAINRP